MTAADHIPARTGPPSRPFAAVSIQVARFTRWPRTLAGFKHSKGIDPNPFGRHSSCAGRNNRFWCFRQGAPSEEESQNQRIPSDALHLAGWPARFGRRFQAGIPAAIRGCRPLPCQVNDDLKQLGRRLDSGRSRIPRGHLKNPATAMREHSR